MQLLNIAISSSGTFMNSVLAYEEVKGPALVVVLPLKFLLVSPQDALLGLLLVASVTKMCSANLGNPKIFLATFFKCRLS